MSCLAALRPNFLVTALLMLGLAPLVEAAPATFSPAELKIRAMNPGQLLQLSKDGSPVPAESIGAVRFMVETRDYTYMLKIQKTNGALLLTPTDDIEMGSYKLYVEVPGETLAIPVLVPLDQVPTSLENLSKAQGKSIEDLKHDLGLFTTLARKQIEIGLPESYTLGQEFRIALTPSEGATYTWKINGVTIETGLGEHTFAYVFPEPGDYVVDYVESRDNVVLAQSVGITMVHAEAPIPWEVDASAAFELKGPGEFTTCAWTVDGELRSASTALQHTFESPGSHTIVCLATQPANGSPGVFRQITYSVTVK